MRSISHALTTLVLLATLNGCNAEGPVDEPTCANFGGLYEGDTTCTDGPFFPELICVRQTGCDLTTHTSLGNRRYTGTATDESGSLASAMSTDTCTIAEGDAQLEVSCETVDGAICSTELTPIDTAGEAPCCDVVAQDCPAEQRCQVVEHGGVMTTACIPTGGGVGLGGSCERQGDVLGRDDCQAGLLCSNYGSPAAAERTCQPLCHDKSDCGTGESCVNIGSGSFPLAGTCAPNCSPLAGAGASDACPNGTVCVTHTAIEGSNTRFTMLCRHSNDDAGEGETCAFSNDCAKGLSCNYGTCTPFCDDANPCAQGTSCDTFDPAEFSGIADDLGVCR